MPHSRALTSSSTLRGLAAIAAFAVALAGCGGGGGGGGGSTASSSTSGTGQQGGSGNFANDFDPPVVTITAPARGAYYEGAASSVTVQGTAVDTGTNASGVQAFSINGTSVALDAQGNFTLPLTLVSGVNTITATAVDRAGNVGVAAISVMYAKQYLDANDAVLGAAGTRLSTAALNTIAPVVMSDVVRSGAITSGLTGTPLVNNAQASLPIVGCVASASVSVTNVSFGTPTLQLATIPGAGLHGTCHVPSLRVDLQVSPGSCGVTISDGLHLSADDVQIDVILDVAVAGGQYQVTAGTTNVAFTNFQYGVNGLPSILTNLVYSLVESEVQSRFEDAIKQQLPPAIGSALAGLAQPISRTVLGKTVTFDAAPQSVAFDTHGIQVDFSANVTAAPDPSVPVVPGSYWLEPPAGTVPSFGATSGFYASVNENLLNRALFASWQAGLWDMTIDSQFLQRLGMSLPFALDGKLIALFFPAVNGMITSGQVVPLAVKLEPLMQPIVEVTGSPDLITARIGELHLTLLADFGAGYQPFFEVALHMRAGASAAFANNEFSFMIGQNVQFDAELLSASIPLNGIDLARFLQFIVPPAIQVATASIAPMPLPTLQGLALANLAIYQDGNAGEFCTVSGDIK